MDVLQVESWLFQQPLLRNGAPSLRYQREIHKILIAIEMCKVCGDVEQEFVWEVINRPAGWRREHLGSEWGVGLVRQGGGLVRLTQDRKRQVRWVTGTFISWAVTRESEIV